MDGVCERGIFFIILGILVWSPLALAAAPPLEFAVVEILTALALALWGVRLWSQRGFRLLWPPVCWGVLAFVLYTIALAPFAPVSAPARQQTAQVIVYGALFFLVLHNFNRRDSATIASMTVIAVGFAVAVAAVVQYTTHPATIWGVARAGQYLRRASGTFLNPNNMAGYLAMIVPLALGFAIMGRRPAVTNVLLAYAALAMMAAIGISLSRGGILATALGLALFCVLLFLQRDFWVPAIITLVCLVTLGILCLTQVNSIQKRMGQIFSGDKVEDQRVFYWQAALRLFDEHKLWGAGPGQFDAEFPSVRPPQVQNRPQFVHNEYLNLLCEWGAAGAIIVGATIGLLFAGAAKTWKILRPGQNELGSARGDRTAFIFGASLGLIALLLHCVVDFNLHMPAVAITAVTLMALLTGTRRFSTERFWKNPRRHGKILLMFVVAGLAIFLGAQAVRSGMAAWWRQEADRPSASGEQILACLQKAHAWAPDNYVVDCALGEYWWALSAQGNSEWQPQATNALVWYGRALAADPFDGFSATRCGMCLDWLGETNEAESYFARAAKNDPNSAFVAMEEGRHYAALGDVDKARHWLYLSMATRWSPDAYWQYQLLERQTKDAFPPGYR